MSRPGVFGGPGDEPERIARLALAQREQRALDVLGATPSPIVMRLAMAALAGVLLLAAQHGAIWAWLGAVFFMLSIAGASGTLAAGAGAIAATIGYMRILDSSGLTGIFWALLLFHAAGGAVGGALIAEMWRKLPPQAFAFLAALLPAGLEHLGSFVSTGNLTSTALTQYAHPAVVKIARLGGLAAVTYVIFLFGGVVAVALRHKDDSHTVAMSALPAGALVVLALIYGVASGSATDRWLFAAAYSPNSRIASFRHLLAQKVYDKSAWTQYTDDLMEAIQRLAETAEAPTTMSSIESTRHLNLIVLPEADAVLSMQARPGFMKRLEAITQTTRCVQVAAFYDLEKDASVAVISGTKGGVAVVDRRRHFVPGVDDEFFDDRIAMPGDTPPLANETVVGKIGAVLSFDGNFFDNFKSIAQSGGQLVCVCGLDDENVPQTSVRLLVFNAAMSGLGVVRSARNGSLMMISPDGRIIAKKQTRADIDVTLKAPVPLGDAKTLFLHVGNVFAWLALLGGIAIGLYASSLEQRSDMLLEREKKPPFPGPSGPITYKTGSGMEHL